VLLRAIAVVLDSAIIFILAVVLIGRENLGYGFGLALYLSGWAAYYVAFTATMGATPGKIAVGLHVASKTGGRPALDSVILRYIVMLVGALLLVATRPGCRDVGARWQAADRGVAPAGRATPPHRMRG
jgi:uncharacterized RDD family membrane protein YckC